MTRTIVAQTNSPAVRRGRPASLETTTEEIEGLGMGVVAETGHGNRHLVKASLFDRMGDNCREQLWNLLDVMQEAYAEGDSETVLAGFQVIGQHLRPEIEKLDRLEDEEFRREAPQHVAAARRDGRSIVGIVTGRMAGSPYAA